MAEKRQSGRGFALLGLASLLVAAGIFGALNPYGLVWVERLLHHTYLFGIAAAVLVWAGFVVLVQNYGARLLTGICCLVVVLGLAGLRWLDGPNGAEIAVVDAPSGPPPAMK